MRVVSLVPSWTETLLEAGVEVVGRTRFCVHPAGRVANIPAVGGTKKVDWELVKKLKPDYVLMDCEENTRDMAERCPFPLLVTHVQKVEDVGRELETLAGELNSLKLMALSARWRGVGKFDYSGDLSLLPGVLRWLRPVQEPPRKILYLIWKKPWMAAGPGTFIASMMGRLGLAPLQAEFAEKYPKIDLADFSPHETLLLFSSEPYPFENDQEELKKMEFSSAVVDGECYSWFGLRSLRFLESL